MEITKQSHRCEVVVEHFVVIKLCSEAASGLRYVQLLSRAEANYPVIAIGVQSDAFDTLFLRKVWEWS